MKYYLINYCIILMIFSFFSCGVDEEVASGNDVKESKEEAVYYSVEYVEASESVDSTFVIYLNKKVEKETEYYIHLIVGLKNVHSVNIGEEKYLNQNPVVISKENLPNYDSKDFTVHAKNVASGWGIVSVGYYDQEGEVSWFDMQKSIAALVYKDLNSFLNQPDSLNLAKRLYLQNPEHKELDGFEVMTWKFYNGNNKVKMTYQNDMIISLEFFDINGVLRREYNLIPNTSIYTLLTYSPTGEQTSKRDFDITEID